MLSHNDDPANTDELIALGKALFNDPLSDEAHRLQEEGSPPGVPQGALKLKPNKKQHAPGRRVALRLLSKHSEDHQQTMEPGPCWDSKRYGQLHQG